MTHYEISLMTPESAQELIANLREADSEELKALGGTVDQLEEGLRKVSHDTWVCRVDGEVACAFGVLPQTILGDTGLMWLLGTPVLFKNVKAFWGISKNVVLRAQSSYDTLTGTVWSRNVKSIRWLRRLGFTVPEIPYPVGPNKEIFYQFFWVKE